MSHQCFQRFDLTLVLTHLSFQSKQLLFSHASVVKGKKETIERLDGKFWTKVNWYKFNVCSHKCVNSATSYIPRQDFKKIMSSSI